MDFSPPSHLINSRIDLERGKMTNGEKMGGKMAERENPVKQALNN